MKPRLFLLLCISVWINYLDRGMLGVVAPVLQSELGLSTAQIGVLLSGFFWTYSLMQPLAGWLIDRYDVYRLYTAGFVLWSAAVMAGGLAGGFLTLLATRLVLGVGESLAYPAYSRILAADFPEARRGFANSMIDVGTKAGPALGTLLGAFVIAQWGWRPFFFLMGAVSLAWLLPWLRAIPARATGTETRRNQGVSLRVLLARRESWVTFAGLFCFNYAFYFLLTWLPTYLLRERHFSLSAMALFGSLPFCATAVASVGVGLWADARSKHSPCPGNVRKRFAVTGLVMCCVMLPATAYAPAGIAMSCLVVAFVGIGFFTANVWAITQTLAGPNAAGSWTGWQNAVGNMGGVIAPIATGWMVSSTGLFLSAFLTASFMLLFAACLYGFGLRNVHQVIDQ
jgi:ACS family D-galactonate transporter-like MFS transporter